MFRRCTTLIFLYLIAVTAAAFPDTRGFSCSVQHQLLDGQGRIVWCVEGANLNILLQAKTTGWVGIGFSDAANERMENADIIMGFVNPDGSLSINDFFSKTPAGAPTVDSDITGGTYDILNPSGWESDDGWTTITFSRRLTSTDTIGDISLNPSMPLDVLFAFGSEDSFSNMHTARIRSRLNVYSSVSNFEPATEYRTINGSGNNVANPTWGAIDDHYAWKAGNAYENNIDAPNGVSRPSARNISNTLFGRPQDAIQKVKISTLLVYFGQLLAHDVSMTSGSSVPADDWPMQIPLGDPMFDPTSTGTATMGFTRSAWDPTTGTSTSNPRMQSNTQTSYMDASQVYGQTDDRAKKLRTMVGGKMLLDEDGLLPDTPDVEMASEAQCPCNMRKAGDARANVHSILFSLHTIFVREHNRWCDVLSTNHPTWDDEKMYQEARRRVVAIWQKISMYEYLPAVLGKPSTLWTAYDSSTPARVSHEFNVCAFRYGHSELPSTIPRYDAAGNEILGGHLSLAENLYDGVNGIYDKQVEPGIRGVTRQRPGASDLLMVDAARNFLFGNPRGTHNGAFDLAARSMQRGRDHGIPHYNQVRINYGLPAITSWEEVSNDTESITLLNQLFPDINDVDLYVGGLAEEEHGASIVGPVYAKILEDDFNRLRDSDRFWFENGQFTPEELAEIHDTRLADVLRRNTDLTTLDIPNNAFYLDARYTEYNIEKDFPTVDGYPDTRGNVYDNEHIVMENAYKMLWRADDKEVHFMLQVKTEGWVGIGFNPLQRGLMIGADMVICRIVDGVVEIKDYSAVLNVGKPAEDVEIDGGVDDIQNIDGWTIQDWSIFKFSRLRDTGDAAADNILDPNTETLTIFAFQAETNEFMYHGRNVEAQLIRFRPATLEVQKLMMHDNLHMSVATAMAVVGVVLTLLALIFQTIHRKKAVISYSSPRINWILMLGAILGYVSIPLFATNPSSMCSDMGIAVVGGSSGVNETLPPVAACEESRVICTSRQWLVSLGFTLVFGSMFSKTLRLYKLFSKSNDLKELKIADGNLLKIISMLVLVEIALLIFWMAADPVYPQRVFTGAQEVSEDFLVRYVDERCGSDGMAFWLISFAIKGVLMLLSTQMSNATKNINYKLPELADFESVGSASYSMLLICLMVLPALGVINEDLDASFLLSIGAIFLCCTSTIMILFLPKVQQVYKPSRSSKVDAQSSLKNVYT